MTAERVETAEGGRRIKTGVRTKDADVGATVVQHPLEELYTSDAHDHEQEDCEAGDGGERGHRVNGSVDKRLHAWEEVQ